MNSAIIISMVVLGAAAAVFGVLCFVSRGAVVRLGDEKRVVEEAFATAQRSAVAAEQERAVAATRLEEAELSRGKAAEELRALQAEHLRTQNELAALRAQSEAEIAALREKLDAQVEAEREVRERQEEHYRLQFKELATEIMGEQTKSFQTLSGEKLELLLKPFRDNIADFRLRVEQIYDTQNQQRGELKAELKQLMELNRTISTEAQNLTTALKGNSKVQGDWGEMVLDTILDSSNLVKGVHYFTQDTIRTEEGNVRPDVVLRLPDRKQIVIDSKTSLTAYAEYCATGDIAQLDAHVASVRKHVAELSSKSYQELMSCSPDFVIMFIPSEPALLTVLQRAPEIWGEAYRKKVVISSPTNLFALLKLVDNLWQRSDLERNTRDIAECGTKIYDQLVMFTDSLTGIDSALQAARRAYDDAFKRFTRGNNNLVRLGQRMVDLHVKFKRQMPQGVIDAAEEDIQEIGGVEQKG